MSSRDISTRLTEHWENQCIKLVREVRQLMVRTEKEFEWEAKR